MLTTIGSQIDEIEVINILKGYRDKKIENDKISSFFIQCCDLVTFSTFLGWSKHICVKQNIKRLEMDKYITFTFQLQRHLSFLKDLFFVFVLFVLVALYISVYQKKKKGYIIISFPSHTISFLFLVSTKKINFHICFILLDSDIHLRKLKKTMITSIYCNVIFVKDRLMNIIYR